jgi:hypothetical protein
VALPPDPWDPSLGLPEILAAAHQVWIGRDVTAQQAYVDRARAELTNVPAGPGRTASDILVHVAAGRLLTTAGAYDGPQLDHTRKRLRASLSALDPAGQPPPAWAWLWEQGVIRGDLAGARVAARQLSVAAGHHPDRRLQVAGQAARGIAAFHMGELGMARDALAPLVALDLPAGAEGTDLGVPLLDQPVVAARVYSALTLCMAGDDADAAGMSRQAAAAASRVGTDAGFALALFGHVMVSVLSGRRERAAGAGGRLTSRDIGWNIRPWSILTAVVRGWAGSDPTRPETAAQLAGALSRLDHVGLGMFRPVIVALLATNYRAAGMPVEALAAVRDGLRHTSTGGERFFDAELYRMQGELLVDLGQDEDGAARESFLQSVSIARHQGVRGSRLSPR